MKNAVRGIGRPAMATVTTRVITIAAPPTRVRAIVESLRQQLGKPRVQIQLSEMPPATPGGSARTRLVVRDAQPASRPFGLAISQETLRDIRDRAEGRLEGTFVAA